MIRSPALALYLAASWLAGPLARALLRRRAARGKEDSARLSERLGRAGRPRPPGRLVWLHGASVGEALSALPLAAELRRQDPDLCCLITTGTVTAARRLADLLPESAVHQFAPIDTAPAVRGFLAHWRPDLAILVESELWPRLIVETARRATPMMLVNARISARSARRWAWVPGMAGHLIGCFARILTQDRPTLERLRALGADPDRLGETGNLKSAAPPPGCDPDERDRLVALIAGRPVWLAASTHPGEEAIVLAAHGLLRGEHPDALLLLAPRHPARGADLDALIRERGLAVARRSAGEGPGGGVAVWLIDSLGDMGLCYRLAPVALVGGSLVARGGHNPFEPAALGTAILHGPSTENFAPAYAALTEAGAARQVDDAASLAAAVAVLWAGPTERCAMTAAAERVCRSLIPDLAAIARDALGLMAGRG